MNKSKVNKRKEIAKAYLKDRLEDDDEEDLKEIDDLDDIYEGDQEIEDDTDFSTYCEALAAKPSTNVWEYWLFCHDLSGKNSIKGKEGVGQKNMTQTGKYLIFEDTKHIDASWEKIKAATNRGLLGFASKVSTKKEKPKDIGGGQDKQVICVYTSFTSSGAGESDKHRVLQSLRNLGYHRHLPYKTDSDTASGIYSKKCRIDGTDIGETVASKYSASEAGISEGKVSVRRPEPDSDSDCKYSEPPKKYKSDSSEAWEEGPIEYVKMYPTKTPYKERTYLHIKQVAPISHSGKQDILFPMDQAVDVGESVYKLGHVVLKNEEDLIEGISTSHVKLWAAYSKDFKKYSIFIKSIKSNSIVSFPQADAVFYYNRIQWFFSKPLY